MGSGRPWLLDSRSCDTVLDVHGGGCHLRHCAGVMGQASSRELVNMCERPGVGRVSNRRLLVETGVCEGNAQRNALRKAFYTSIAVRSDYTQTGEAEEALSGPRPRHSERSIRRSPLAYPSLSPTRELKGPLTALAASTGGPIPLIAAARTDIIEHRATS